jgi:ABC-type cobalamin/Fe3+-siderophores transport system ATPase subunit
MELNLKALSFNRHKQVVLAGVSVTIPSTGFTCLLGTNGAGKSPC